MDERTLKAIVIAGLMLYKRGDVSGAEFKAWLNPPDS
jgi:hypothetical protein